MHCYEKLIHVRMALQSSTNLKYGNCYCSYGTPCSSATVLRIDPTTDTATTFGAFGAATFKYFGVSLVSMALYMVCHIMLAHF